MPTFVKPSWPVWQSGKAPAGCKLYLPLAEGSGTTVRDYAGGYVGSLVGTPDWQPWQQGLYGPQLGGFSLSDYVTVNAASSVLTIYPRWMATLASNANIATNGVSIGAGNSSDATPICAIQYNLSGTGNLTYQQRGSLQVHTTAAGLAAINDGLPHVAMAVSLSATDHRLYWDGRLVASSTANPGAMALNTLAVGVLLRTGSASPFLGAIQWAGLGTGSVPDPLSFAQDLLSGRFTPIRPDSNLALWAAVAGGSPSPAYSPAAMMMGF